MNLQRRLQQVRAPFRKDWRDPVVIFFSGEIIEARVDLEERGIEGRVRAIVWFEAKLAVRKRRFLGIERSQKWNCAEQGYENSLAGSDEEVTPWKAAPREIHFWHLRI